MPLAQGTMPRCRWLSLILLTIPLALVARKDPKKNETGVLRKLKPVNASNANVKQCLWFAMQEYNKESEDKYVFLVVKTLQAQLQVKVSLHIGGHLHMAAQLKPD